MSIKSNAGFCYPKAGRRWGNTHYKIFNDLRNGQVEESLGRAFEEANSQEAIVLSCEGFWVIQEEEVEGLRRALAGYDVRVILYLRRPPDYVTASYRQKIKRAGETCTPEVYWRSGPIRPQLNYSNLLERWGSRFPIRVRAYAAVRNGIEKDFMHAIEAPVQHLDTQRRVANATPTDGVIRLMLMVNRYLPEVLAERVRRWIKKTNWRLDFMPTIEDGVLREKAKAVIERWDLDVMQEYLPNDDLKRLLADRSVASKS